MIIHLMKIKIDENNDKSVYAYANHSLCLVLCNQTEKMPWTRPEFEPGALPTELSGRHDSIRLNVPPSLNVSPP